MRNMIGFTGVLVFSSAVFGQSFNVNIGLPGQTPPASYGGAGIPGVWNDILTAHNSTTFNVRDITGQVTDVNIWQFGGTELMVFNDPATTGNDDALLDECLLTYTPSLETCLFFRELDLGAYEVVIYAWKPGNPSVLSYTNTDEEPMNPDYIVGGAWPGQHQQYVTYSRHIAYVTHVTGLLRTHSGIVPGQPAANGAAMNGVQIRKLPPQNLGDMNCDARVNGRDISLFITALFDHDTYSLAQPTCNVTNADMNGDQFRTIADLSLFVDQVLEG